MPDCTRRTALQYASTLGVLAAAPSLAAAGRDDEPLGGTDRQFVLDSGFTEREADCWAHLAAAAGAFFDLEELHPMDAHEVATAIHVVQNKLLARPTYRAYLERAKAGR